MDLKHVAPLAPLIPRRQAACAGCSNHRISTWRKSLNSATPDIGSETGKHSRGAKTDVAKYSGTRLRKSGRTTTSNRAEPQLTKRQIAYLANDE